MPKRSMLFHRVSTHLEQGQDPSGRMRSQHLFTSTGFYWSPQHRPPGSSREGRPLAGPSKAAVGADPPEVYIIYTIYQSTCVILCML